MDQLPVGSGIRELRWDRVKFTFRPIALIGLQAKQCQEVLDGRQGKGEKKKGVLTEDQPSSGMNPTPTSNRWKKKGPPDNNPRPRDGERRQIAEDDVA